MSCRWGSNLLSFYFVLFCFVVLNFIYVGFEYVLVAAVFCNGALIELGSREAGYARFKTCRLACGMSWRADSHTLVWSVGIRSQKSWLYFSDLIVSVERGLVDHSCCISA